MEIELNLPQNHFHESKSLELEDKGEDGVVGLLGLRDLHGLLPRRQGKVPFRITQTFISVRLFFVLTHNTLTNFLSCHAGKKTKLVAALGTSLSSRWPLVASTC